MEMGTRNVLIACGVLFLAAGILGGILEIGAAMPMFASGILGALLLIIGLILSKKTSRASNKRRSDRVRISAEGSIKSENAVKSKDGNVGKPEKNSAMDASAELVSDIALTGDAKTDALIAEGKSAIAEMCRLQDMLNNEQINSKLSDIITVIKMIFMRLTEDSSVFKQVKRFAEYYLPMTIKLLDTYYRFEKSGHAGDNISGTMERIDKALDTILESYRKLYDSLFESQALDIETDIMVMEKMLKSEGLMNSW
jgi:hypothetical protein